MIFSNYNIMENTKFYQKIKKLKKTINISSSLFCSFATNKSFQEIIQKYHKILFLTDKNIYPKSKKIIKFLSIRTKIILLSNPKADIKVIKKIIKNDFDFILAFGSGTINDLAKYSSFTKNVPYSIIASAPSMNGYNSANASITIKNKKKSLKAHLPIKSFFDLKFLQNSPKRLIKAGIGDSLCVTTCNFDWLLANFFQEKIYDSNIYQMLRKNFDNLCNSSYKNPQFIKILCQNLISSGLAMTIFGSSDPASQSEHLISHYLEMKYPKFSQSKFHGEHIAISSLIILKIQEIILKQEKLFFQKNEIDKAKIMQIFSDKNIVKFCNSQLKKKQINHIKINQKLQKKWHELKNNLSNDFISLQKMIEIYQKFDIETEDKNNQDLYIEGSNNALLIRDRFTCLDIFPFNKI